MATSGRTMNASVSTDVERVAADWLARRDGEAWTQADAAALEAWLDADTAHRVALLRLQAAWDESRRLQALGAGWKQPGPPPRGYWHAPVATRDAVPPHRSGKPPLGWLARTISVAAVATCVLAAGWGWRVYTQVDAASYRTALGAIETLPLADGSQATLASDSRIEVRLSRRERRIELAQGEAIFAVAKDPRRPFVVDTGAHRVVAVGTRFSVRHDGPDLRIVVTEGTVRLESRGGARGSRPAALLPAGSVALVRRDDVLVRSLPPAEADLLLDWRDGLLAFRDTSLAEAAAEFNRYNARKIVIADATTAALRIGGSFRWNNAEGFVRLLEQGFPVRADYAEEQIVLHDR